MSRSDEYLESMLRDLGAVYYQTLHGEASEADVATAVESVRSHKSRSSQVGASSQHDGADALAAGQSQGRCRVRDVMTTDVLTVDKNMPYKQVVRLLTEGNLCAVPVVSGGGRVLGIVSEADALRKQERFFSRRAVGLPRRTRRERQQAEARTAAKLMTSPVVTIHPDAPLGAAARLMNGHHIQRLPVVDPGGELLGMVSRHDLLSVFLRPDAQITAQITSSLARIRPAGQMPVAVTVCDGEVTLTGELATADLIGAAIRVTSEVDGVVAVTSRLTVGRQLLAGH